MYMYLLCNNKRFWTFELWITIFGSLAKRFANDFHSRLSHSWKYWQIVSLVTPKSVLTVTLYTKCYPHENLYLWGGISKPLHGFVDVLITAFVLITVFQIVSFFRMTSAVSEPSNWFQLFLHGFSDAAYAAFILFWKVFRNTYCW